MEGVRRQADLVQSVIEGEGQTEVPVTPTLCFVGSEWAIPTRHIAVRSVVVAELGGLARLVRHRGPLDRAERSRLAHLLDRALPPR